MALRPNAAEDVLIEKLSRGQAALCQQDNPEAEARMQSLLQHVEAFRDLGKLSGSQANRITASVAACEGLIAALE